jgi:ribA/ribD-fused uncharacterized protein
MTREIKLFDGPFRWLSNFGTCVPFEYEGITYPTTEHFYQALKSLDPAIRKEVAALATPGKAKKAGKKLACRPDWEDVKDDVMKLALRLKFVEGTALAEKLLDTQDANLVEGNTWNDTYWGVNLSTGEGQNKLGKFLMERREELRSKV